MSLPPIRDVDLGVAVEPENPKTIQTHHFFPIGKVGGQPAWLGLDPLPTAEDLQCGICQEPTAFLLQIYCPVEDGREDCFHRTIFVFICRNPNCCQPNSSANLRVFRSQLPRDNPYYGSEPLDPDDPKALDGAVLPESFGHVCVICGAAATKKCGKCMIAWYCSKSHQARHWRGGHKKECSEDLKALRPFHDSIFLFPELEITMSTERKHPRFDEGGEGDEEEDEEDDDDDEFEEERDEAVRMAEYKRYVEKHAGSLMGDDAISDAAFPEEKSNKRFKLFQRRVILNPDQILRYQRGGDTLWAGEDIPETIPPCESCGAERVFEFQLMPNLLHHLEVDCLGQSIDWATVAIYTCKDSCKLNDGRYAAEFIHKQAYEE